MDPVHNTWWELVVDFTQTTTCHGVRFLTLEAKWLRFLRRLCWCIAVTAAAAGFCFLTVTKMLAYFQYAINVNVEVKYSNTMNYPAVTICNQNKYKLSALQKLGLYDVHQVMRSPGYRKGIVLLSPEQYNGDRYFYLNTTCQVPNTVVWSIQFNLTTRKTCATLCSSSYSLNCSSFLYDQSSQHCILSSYTGRLCRSNCGCHPSGPLEFYVRRRRQLNADVACRFSPAEKCQFNVENVFLDKHDAWVLTKAKSSVPSKDVTIESGEGYYLMLANTARRPGYTANYASDFLQTKGKCVSFYFKFLGELATISVIVRNAELQESKLSTVSWYNPFPDNKIDFNGKHYWQELPSGEYQVIIQAVRNSKPGSASGMAIDNLLVVNCSESDCIRSRTGVDYVGNLSYSQSKKPCLPWLHPTVQTLGNYSDTFFPDLFLSPDNNYCRNPMMSRKQKPFCYVYSENGHVQWEYCDVTYCACRRNIFKCDSGFCIPKHLLCDGVDDCGDNSDESSTCGHKTSISCSFEDGFICGYISNSSALQWTFHQKGMLAMKDDPGSDSTGNTLGHYLLIDNRGIISGGKARVSSPQQKLSGVIGIHFYIYMNLFKNTTEGLVLFLLDSSGNRMKKLIQHKNSTYNNQHSTIIAWQQLHICVAVSPGNYSLEFEGTLGINYGTVLALDNVVIDNMTGACSEPVQLNASPWDSCTFDVGNTCVYTQQTENYWTSWRVVSATKVQYVINQGETATSTKLNQFDTQYCSNWYHNSRICHLNYYDMTGNILSPEFPNALSSKVKVFYIIHAANVSSIFIQSHYANLHGKDFVKVEAFLHGHMKGQKKYHQNDFPISPKYYVISLSNQDLPLTNVDKGILVFLDFPTVHVTSESSDYCFSFRAIVGTHLTVILQTQKGAQIISQIDYVPYWDTYFYHVTGQSSPFFLRFIGNLVYGTSMYARHAIFLDDIKLTLMLCNETSSDIASVSCTFEEGTCGYQLISQKDSNAQWRRVRATSLFHGNMLHNSFHINEKEQARQKGMILLATFIFGASKRNIATLRLPKITTQNESCLTLEVYCVYYKHFKFDIKITTNEGFVMSGSLDRVLHGCIKNSWFTTHVQLPSGNLSFEIDATVIEGYRPFSFAYYAIDNVLLLEGTCNNTENVLNFTKESDTSKNLTFPNATSRNFSVPNSGLHFINYTLPQPKGYIQTGTELGDINVMIKHIANLSMKEMVNQTSHTIDDMLLGCSWNSESCSKSDFTPVFTGMGLCYTFNAGGSWPLTQITGSGTGLELILNAEQYEYTEGYNSNGGFKVFIHDPAEISYIKYLGSGVPTGMYALLPIIPETIKHLGGKYGNCSSTPEKVYPNEPYSLFRCKEACRLRNMLAACGCRESWMPGDANVCTLTDYVSCSYSYTFNQSLQQTIQCTCTKACDKRQYSTSMSFGRLSKMNTNIYLQLGNQTTLQRKFHQVLELTNRMDTQLFTGFLNPFKYLLGNYTQFMRHILYDVTDSQTSIIGLIKEALLVLQKTAIKEIDGLFKDLSMLVNAYNNEVKSLIKSVSHPMEELIRTMYEYLATEKTDVKLLLTLEDELIGLIDICIRRLKAFSSRHQSLVASGNDFIPSNITLNYICFDTYFIKVLNLSNTLMNLKADISEMICIHNSSSNNFTERHENSILTNMNANFRNLTSRFYNTFLQICCLPYGDFLNELTKFLSTVQPLNFVTINTYSIQTELNLLSSNFFEAQIIYDKYTRGAVRKGEVTQLLSAEVLNQWMVQVDRVYTTVDQEAFQTINIHLLDVYKHLLDLYNKSLLHAVTLGSYWKGNSSYLQQQAQQIHLWLKPVPNLQIDKLITYELTTIQNSWSSDQNLEQFVKSSMDFILRTRLDLFFTHLRSSLNILQNYHLQEAISSIKYSAGLMRANLANYEASTQMDGTMVTENFASLNIFYSESKYSYIQDLPSYDAASFFSDIGGYMGLLIGMSVLTLVEVIDLILYNTFVKCAIALQVFQKTKKVEMT